MQIARILTDCEDGFLNGQRNLIMDRDSKFCASFRAFLKNEDTEPLRLPPRSPNLNAYLERFMKSIKSKCLEKMIFFGEKSLRKAVQEFLRHYHEERNHQGLDNQLIEPTSNVVRLDKPVQKRKRLGGILNHYYREAA